MFEYDIFAPSPRRIPVLVTVAYRSSVVNAVNGSFRFLSDWRIRILPERGRRAVWVARSRSEI
jgi:hypothetical protein